MIKIFFRTHLVFSIAILFAQKPFDHQMIYQSESGVINPQISSDGKYLSFTLPNYIGLYLLNMSDKSVLEITNETAAGFGYSWSTSGDAIAYKPAFFLEKRRYNSLVVYELESGLKNVIISDKMSLPGKIIWIDRNNIYLAGNTKIKGNYNLTFKSSTRSEYYNFEKNTIYLVSKDNKKRRPFLKNIKEIHDMAVSPNGEKILYEEYGGNLIMINIEDQSTINLGIGHEAEWSPDGSKIVFMRTDDDGYNITQSDIYVVKSDGTDLINVTHGTDLIAMRPTWVDNTHIIYDTDINNELYMAEVQR